MRLLYCLIGILLIVGCKSTTEPSEENDEMETTSTEAAIEVAYTPRFDYDSTKWLDILDIEPSILIDIKYATTHNFVEEKMYDCGRCFLRPEVAKAVAVAHKELQEIGLGFKMYDCYRPRPFQQRLWDKVPDARYVTPPDKGSMHNRGAAVDLTIVDAGGKELAMGTGYDYFGKEAYHTYTDHSDTIQANRDLLKEILAKYGFKHIRTEWWHYSYQLKSYALSDWVWNCDGIAE